jgi:hypothetical protein
MTVRQTDFSTFFRLRSRQALEMTVRPLPVAVMTNPSLQIFRQSENDTILASPCPLKRRTVRNYPPSKGAGGCRIQTAELKTANKAFAADYRDRLDETTALTKAVTKKRIVNSEQ